MYRFSTCSTFWTLPVFQWNLIISNTFMVNVDKITVTATKARFSHCKSMLSSLAVVCEKLLGTWETWSYENGLGISLTNCRRFSAKYSFHLPLTSHF